MTYISLNPRKFSAPMILSMPQEVGIVALKSLAFATALVASSTSSAHATSIGSVRLDSSSVTACVAARDEDTKCSLSSALAEIRKKSGLTWAQLANLFDVSRRTIHSWANGAAVRSTNAARVLEVLDRIDKLNGLPAFKIRDELLGSSNSSKSDLAHMTGEPPILMSDNSPFVHQLSLRPARTRIRRS